MDSKAPDTRGANLMDSGGSSMEHWDTSLYGLEPEDDERSDEERYPPPAATPPETVEPVDKTEEIASSIDP